jgi:type I restriction enzyme R subunit
VVGVVEAKKLSVSPQGVLTQAERYAAGVTGGPFDFRGLKVPFLYSTNGEVIYFHDVRDSLNLSRRVKQFHTPAALEEMLGRDLTVACGWFAENPNTHSRLLPYQREANAAVEQAIAQRKRTILLAMAAGTGKTFTLVNQVYRLRPTRGCWRRPPARGRRGPASTSPRGF